MLTLLNFRDSNVRRSRLLNELNRSTLAKHIFAGIAACCAMGFASEASADNEIQLHAPLNSTLKVSTAKTNWTKRDAKTATAADPKLASDPAAGKTVELPAKGSIKAIPASGPLDRFRKSTSRNLTTHVGSLGAPVPSKPDNSSVETTSPLSKVSPTATETRWQNRTASKPLGYSSATASTTSNPSGAPEFRAPIQEGTWIARDAVNRIAPLRDPLPSQSRLQSQPGPKAQFSGQPQSNGKPVALTEPPQLPAPRSSLTEKTGTAIGDLAALQSNSSSPSSPLNDSWTSRTPDPTSSNQTNKPAQAKVQPELESPLKNQFGSTTPSDTATTEKSAVAAVKEAVKQTEPALLQPALSEDALGAPGELEFSAQDGSPNVGSALDDPSDYEKRTDIESDVSDALPAKQEAKDNTASLVDKILSGPEAELKKEAEKSVNSAPKLPRSVELRSPSNSGVDSKETASKEDDRLTKDKPRASVAELETPKRTPFRPESEAGISIARRNSRGEASNKPTASAPRKLEKPVSAKPLASESASGRVGDLEREDAPIELDYTGRPASEIRPTRAVTGMKRGMERVLQYFYDRPEIATGRSNWGMMHALMVYGVDTKVVVGRKKFSAIAWIAGNNNCRGQRLLTNDPSGILAKSGAGLQGHQGQFLAVLGMCNVPLDYPLHAGNVKYTVRDLLEAEKRACKTGEELTFTLIGLSHYIDTDSTWMADDGTQWDFQRLLEEELKQPIVGAACGGTHRLMGYSHALRKRRAEGKPVEGHWKRAEVYTKDFIDYAYSLQNRDGSMSTKWFEGRADNGDVDRKIQTTGHIVEWLLTLTPDDQLQNPRLIRAVNFLSRSLGADLRHDWSIGPKGHALRSLAMYHQRVFQTGSPWVSRGQSRVANGGSSRYR